VSRLRIALPKGRMLGDALAALAAAGCAVPDEADLASRRLLFVVGGIEWILVKDADVPVYVERGAACAGIAGSDQLVEQAPDVYEPVELPFGRCGMWLIARGDAPPLSAAARIATKYPRTARAFLASRGSSAEVVPLAGSVELAAVLGVTSHIVDLVETGATLRANDLVALEQIAAVAPRLIVNKAAHRFDRGGIRGLIARLEKVQEVERCR
jgi:ATP phosphoribosyltransferase